MRQNDFDKIYARLVLLFIQGTLEGAENRYSTATGASATILPPMSEAENQFLSHPRSVNESAERKTQFLGSPGEEGEAREEK